MHNFNSKMQDNQYIFVVLFSLVYCKLLRYNYYDYDIHISKIILTIISSISNTNLNCIDFNYNNNIYNMYKFRIDCKTNIFALDC